ncbi:HDIG domain-containing protein [Bradyrhizobium sp. SSBR45G]|uniref:HD-GYP domain-containing protein n=1 Tax=unclassified Bradyrhizobium TaxID=2631580 RepID=UPI002342B6D8|nr:MULTISPECIES: HD domain-containing phosphohydrolase [unclassified Bradyrhizobium]GLH79286.1 HDIG domain-containing protein [Bradyrhizobium sp. SSBR45G]GLH86778.1 HDIG domain-containing protein [Bradyrhizobium sp. SSBR45R]
MNVHLVGDDAAKLALLRGLLAERCSLTSEMIGDADIKGGNIDAIVVAADLRDVDNITALKEISDQLARIPRRIFLTNHKSRLSTVQAYALGATSVLSSTPSRNQLLGKLLDARPASAAKSVAIEDRQAAFAGAACIASMFAAVLNGAEIDIDETRRAGKRIADCVAENGLSDWLATVRRHHEGTYQHCLLVTGITVDFGLSLGVHSSDLERLYMAAMFHDIGKAKIPLTILDKPGRLDVKERSLVETHPAAGYEALKDNAAITAEVLNAVRHHHEFLDGSGYPDGLMANNIPDLTRILTISDIFSALIEYRSYKPVMAREKAYEILQGMEGKLEKPLIGAFRDVALIR